MKKRTQRLFLALMTLAMASLSHAELTADIEGGRIFYTEATDGRKVVSKLEIGKPGENCEIIKFDPDDKSGCRLKTGELERIIGSGSNFSNLPGTFNALKTFVGRPVLAEFSHDKVGENDLFLWQLGPDLVTEIEGVQFKWNVKRRDSNWSTNYLKIVSSMTFTDRKAKAHTVGFRTDAWNGHQILHDDLIKECKEVIEFAAFCRALEIFAKFTDHQCINATLTAEETLIYATHLKALNLGPVATFKECVDAPGYKPMYVPCQSGGTLWRNANNSGAPQAANAYLGIAAYVIWKNPSTQGQEWMGAFVAEQLGPNVVLKPATGTVNNDRRSNEPNNPKAQIEPQKSPEETVMEELDQELGLAYIPHVLKNETGLLMRNGNPVCHELFRVSTKRPNLDGTIVTDSASQYLLFSETPLKPKKNSHEIEAAGVIRLQDIAAGHTFHIEGTTLVCDNCAVDGHVMASNTTTNVVKYILECLGATPPAKSQRNLEVKMAGQNVTGRLYRFGFADLEATLFESD